MQKFNCFFLIPMRKDQLGFKWVMSVYLNKCQLQNSKIDLNCFKTKSPVRSCLNQIIFRHLKTDWLTGQWEKHHFRCPNLRSNRINGDVISVTRCSPTFLANLIALTRSTLTTDGPVRCLLIESEIILRKRGVEVKFIFAGDGKI